MRPPPSRPASPRTCAPPPTTPPVPSPPVLPSFFSAVYARFSFPIPVEGLVNLLPAPPVASGRSGYTGFDPEGGSYGKRLSALWGHHPDDHSYRNQTIRALERIWRLFLFTAHLFRPFTISPLRSWRGTSGLIPPWEPDTHCTSTDLFHTEKDVTGTDAFQSCTPG